MFHDAQRFMNAHSFRRAVVFSGAVGIARCPVRPPTPPIGLSLPTAVVDSPMIIDRSVLGRVLFFDPRLSRDSSVSCASCHVPTTAFAERHSVSHGIGPDARHRNTPTLLNVGLQRHLGWDGAAESLQEQLLQVFSIDGDMGIDLGEAIVRVRQAKVYQRMFRRTFGYAPDVRGLLAALAAFQNTLLAAGSEFDRFFFEGDSTALSESAIRGFKLFETVGCSGCHNLVEPDNRGLGAALLTDKRFHNLGVGYVAGRMTDVGRYAVTQKPAHWGAFKTPSLRNVALTAPYMHDGSLATLEDVVHFYVDGGIKNPNLDPSILPLRLSNTNQGDLVAFLGALTSNSLRDTAAVRRRWARYDRLPPSRGRSGEDRPGR